MLQAEAGSTFAENLGNSRQKLEKIQALRPSKFPRKTIQAHLAHDEPLSPHTRQWDRPLGISEGWGQGGSLGASPGNAWPVSVPTKSGLTPSPSVPWRLVAGGGKSRCTPGGGGDRSEHFQSGDGELLDLPVSAAGKLPP